MTGFSRWAFTAASGDFEVTARVANVQNIDRWTKAGVMIRESAAPGSRHASIFATPGTEKPISFQRRPVANGASVHTGGVVNAPPVWLMLRRAGDVIAAFYRTTTSGAWVSLGTQTLTGLPSSVQVGLAVSSHVDGTLRGAAAPRGADRPGAGDPADSATPRAPHRRTRVTTRPSATPRR